MARKKKYKAIVNKAPDKNNGKRMKFDKKTKKGK